MTSHANVAQFEAWNGDSGHRWVARADDRDRVLTPVADAMLDAAGMTAGTRVLDVGCGCGATTLRAAEDIGDGGWATGVDISVPMLEVARRRARSAGVVTADFVEGDAQTHDFEPGSFDSAISRFGTMFFSDPTAAFANIAAALRPEGRLCIATWQSFDANEWLAIPGAVLAHHTEIPEMDPNEPGMFGQSDPAVVAPTLGGAGFVDITFDARDVTFNFGPTLEDGVTYLAGTGAGRLPFEAIAEGPARDAAFADVRDALVDHHDDSGVHLGGAIWLITATLSG